MPDPREVPTGLGADFPSELGPFSSRWWPRGRPWKGPQRLDGRARKSLFEFFIFLSLAGSSPPSCRALDRRSLESATSPLRGDGMLEPEGSVAAGLGGGAWPIPSPPPPTPRGLGEGEAPRLACPTLTGHWAWRPVGKAFPGPSGPKACLCSPSLRPALLFGAEAPELSEGRHSPPQC